MTPHERAMRFMTTYADEILDGTQEEEAIQIAVDHAMRPYTDEVRAHLYSCIVDNWNIVEINQRLLLVEHTFAGVMNG